ncbi:MAG: GNAT family N-acetyltransferase [Clostridia bacterium]|nr:GNAT family N-acetyltransferase [Clostridia bacterium]
MEKIKFIDYDVKYKDKLMELETNQWGEGSDSDEIIENIENYFVKLAVNSANELAGTLICHKKNEDTLYLDMVVLSPKFQKMGLGTEFIKILIDYAKKLNCRQIETEAIEANGHTNSKKLLENFGFVETRFVKNYWGELCPEFHCKECGHNPCTCTMHEYFKYL